ncbi:Lysine-specific demethylase 4C [Varanus komodoensis]|nr:Lysine-specific demethylase 4C [Varanus komodoensis]
MTVEESRELWLLVGNPWEEDCSPGRKGKTQVGEAWEQLIKSRDCLKLGPPTEGEVVQVKWPDGKLYGAKYLGTNVAYMYNVEFEDGSQIATKREEIYTLDEELPKRVRARFSTASDMRFEDTFYGADIIQGQKKRQRVLSSRFKNEYVDDPGYRSFLKTSFQKKCQKGL